MCLVASCLLGFLTTENNLDSSSLLKHFQFLFAGAGGRPSLPSVAPPEHLPNPSNISGRTIKRHRLDGFSGLIVLSQRKSTHFWTKAATQFPSIGCHGVIFLQTHSQRGEHWRGYIFRTVAGYRTISCHYQWEDAVISRRLLAGLRHTRQHEPHCLSEPRVARTIIIVLLITHNSVCLIMITI